jgi:predicted enzyme related to lactoylglutathione lyase
MIAGPRPDVGNGRVSSFDIVTTDVQKSITFYGALFAWEFDGNLQTDRVVQIISNKVSIGTVRASKEMPSAGNGMLYIQVGNILAGCNKAKELGGTVPEGFPFNPPHDRGSIALVADPAGHTIGIYYRTPMP